MDSLIPGETARRNEVWWEQIIELLVATPATAGQISVVRKGFPFIGISGRHYIERVGNITPTLVLQVRHLYTYLDDSGNQLPGVFEIQDELVRLYRTINSWPSLPSYPKSSPSSS